MHAKLKFWMKATGFVVVPILALVIYSCGSITEGINSDNSDKTTAQCTASVCGNYCIDLSSDIYNCGRCGAACASGETCNNGVCFTPSIHCGSGRLNCNGTCTDVVSNVNNCGGCGNVCFSGGTCINGECDYGSSAACATNETLCGGGTCTDLKSDVKNCGSCGNDCPPGSTCANGMCDYGSR